MSLILYGLLLSLASPLLLIPIEVLIPTPFIIEELVKLGIVILILKSNILNDHFQTRWVILAGALFTLSESMLYLINIFAVGDFSLFGIRLVCTGILHISTMLILFWSTKKGFMGMMGGYILAALIHYWYNSFVITLFLK